MWRPVSSSSFTRRVLTTKRQQPTIVLPMARIGRRTSHATSMLVLDTPWSIVPDTTNVKRRRLTSRNSYCHNNNDCTLRVRLLSMMGPTTDTFFLTQKHRYFSANHDKQEPPTGWKPKKPATKSPTDNHPSSSSSWHVWNRQLTSLPNMITLSRIVSTPLLAYWIVTDQPVLALVGCTLAAISDGVDGYIAKHYQQSTVLGTYLDPLADKVLINGLAMALWIQGTLPTPLVVVWIVKDVTLIVGTYRHVAQKTDKDKHFVMNPLTTPLQVNPTTTSKLNTVFQFATLVVGIVNPLIPMEGALQAMCWITGTTTMASGLSYLDYSAFTKSGNQTDDTKKPPTTY